jgi:four helix bundle protein
MSTFHTFEDIEAWQASRRLTRDIYRISKRGTFRLDFALRDQIRRASISVMSNIAKGFDRGSNREFAHQLSVATGSAGEVRSQLYVALDEGYVTQAEFAELAARTVSITRMIYALIRYLESGAVGRKRNRPRRQ